MSEGLCGGVGCLYGRFIWEVEGITTQKTTRIELVVFDALVSRDVALEDIDAAEAPVAHIALVRLDLQMHHQMALETIDALERLATESAGEAIGVLVLGKDLGSDGTANLGGASEVLTSQPAEVLGVLGQELELTVVGERGGGIAGLHGQHIVVQMGGSRVTDHASLLVVVPVLMLLAVGLVGGVGRRRLHGGHDGAGRLRVDVVSIGALVGLPVGIALRGDGRGERRIVVWAGVKANLPTGPR